MSAPLSLGNIGPLVDPVLVLDCTLSDCCSKLGLLYQSIRSTIDIYGTLGVCVRVAVNVVPLEPVYQLGRHSTVI